MRAVLALLALFGCQPDAEEERARALLHHHGCPTCHVIPGIAGPQGATGPPLQAMADQAYVAGVLPNTPETLARFITDPQGVDPRSAMPNVGVTQDEAHLIAAFLYGNDR